MCLSAVYEVKDGNESLICEYTTSLNIEGSVITLTDIMGEEVVFTGALKSVDLVKNIIILESKTG